MKQYVPIGNFERATSFCPTYVAWHVLDEARNYFRTDFPKTYASDLARRAEIVLARHPFWQRKFQSTRGRECLLTSMRHWLSGILAREKPALFRQLPENFKIGEPLPIEPLSRPKKPRKRTSAPRSLKSFVHGCELLSA